MRLRFCFLSLVLVLGSALAAQAQEMVQNARGRVFHDTDGDGLLDEGERGIEGVCVSNGRDVVRTRGDGSYNLGVVPDSAIFVIKPRNWMVPLTPGTGLPRFYYLHKPLGSSRLRHPGVEPTGALPEQIDFPLVPREEPDQLRVVLLGDTQVRDQREVDFLAHDLVEELVGVDAAFGVTLGDLVFDDLRVFAPLTRAIGLVGLPWFHVIGNHDQNYDAATPEQADECYERVLGPSTYSFDWGPAHFVVLNDVMWEPERRRYHAELGERRRRFLRGDLRTVPRERLVVLLMHIPIMQLIDRAETLAILSEHPRTLSFSAHTHTYAHHFLGAKDGWKGPGEHHHVIHGTACGGWWSGIADEHGIPHATMSDGGPNGYSILSIDGPRYSLGFKAARRPADCQLRLYAPEVVAPGAVAQTEVVVNVFAGSERSRVEMCVGAAERWLPMERFAGRDPGFVQLHGQYASLAKRVAAARKAKLDPALARAILGEFRWLIGLPLPGPSQTGHLWRARLPAELEPGCHLIRVRETDMFGQVHRGCRAIRVSDG